MKISIIIPSYNQGHFIEQTIVSIINQSYTNYEIIIIDGGSIDNTIEIIKKYEENITYWESVPDKGQSDAINKGLERATGDIFNWLNSDDFLEPNAFETIVKAFCDNPTMEVVCGYTRCFFDDDNSTSHVYQMGLKTNVMDTILNVRMNQPGTFYKLSVVNAVGGVNTTLKYVMDNELWFKYLIKFGIAKVGLIDKTLAQFRLHRNSKSVNDGFILFNKESTAIWQYLACQYNLSDSIKANLRKEESVEYYNSKPWVGNNMNCLALENHFASKYLFNLIKSDNYSLARRGWIYQFLKHKNIGKRFFYTTFLKLFIFPGFFKN